jgi:hypothetical protein
MDPREAALRQGLSQLTAAELATVLATPDADLLCDGGNYDPATGRYCPLAIAFRLPDLLAGGRPTDAGVARLIGLVGRARDPGFVYNQLRGTPGDFYRHDRAGDLKAVCRDLLAADAAGVAG